MRKNDNLIGKGLEKGTERTLRIARKGGRVKSFNKKRGAKLREIRKRINAGQLKAADEEWLLARIENKEMMDLDLLAWLDKLRKESPDEFYDAKLLSLYNNIAKQLHPQTQRVDVNVKTLNLNEPIPAEMLKLLTEDFEK